MAPDAIFPPLTGLDISVTARSVPAWILVVTDSDSLPDTWSPALVTVAMVDRFAEGGLLSGSVSP
ncbi:hypothetical protein MnBA_16900 [Marinobacterium sp. BA1]